MKNKKRRIALIIVGIAATLTLTFNAFSLFDSDRAVHINPKEIPASTMIIGTHLIYLTSLTQPLYDIALSSATEANQPNIYYKSELADGTWFDITAAGSITDITTGSNNVPDSEIEALFVEYHTKDDGITYDLRTDQQINIFNIVDPYDIESLPELLPIKNQHQAEQGGENNKDKIKFMEEVLKKKVKNSETDQYDKYISSLDRYYAVLNDNGGTKNNKDTVMGVEESVDATRRVIVLNKIGKILEGSISAMTEKKNVKVLDDDGSILAELDTLSAMELEQSYQDSITNVQDSIIKYAAKALGQGTTIMSKLKFELQMALIDDATSKNDRQCDEDVADIQALDNISSGVIIDRDRELSMLEEKLIPEAERIFEADKSAGENQEYRTAALNQSSTVILDRILGDYYNTLTSEVTELEMYLDAVCQRVKNSDAQALIQGKLDRAYTYADTVVDDQFKIKALQGIQDYITWLERKLVELKAAAGGNEIDVLQGQKDNMTEQYLSALDRNDLLGAKSIMSEINDLANKMAELNQDSSPNAKLIDDLTNQAMGLISDTGANVGDPGGLGGFGGTGEGNGDPNIGVIGNILDSMNQLMESDYKTAFPAVQKIGDAMKAQKYSTASENNAFDEMIDKTKEIIATNQDLYEAGTVGIKDLKDVDGIIDDFLANLDGLNDAGKALVKIQALNKVLAVIPGGSHYDTVNNKMNATAQQEKIKRNPYVFNKMRVTDGVYAPITAVSAKTGLRYVWYVSQNNAVLAKGAERYEFTTFSKRVTKNGEDSNMPLAALAQGYLYIPSGYISSEWSLITINLSKSEFGILIDNDIDQEAEKLMQLILN